MKSVSCRDCNYWFKVDHISEHKDDPQAHWGFCKRFPPNLAQQENDFGILVNQSPVTDADDLCGEFSERVI